jgi:DNA mismatch repair ATPase MutS
MQYVQKQYCVQVIGGKMCVQVIGVAYVDVVLRQIQVCQFVDVPNLVNLESITVQLRAKECLVVSATENDTRAASLKLLMERSGVTVTERKKGMLFQVSVSCDFLNILHPLKFSGVVIT